MQSFLFLISFEICYHKMSLSVRRLICRGAYLMTSLNVSSGMGLSAGGGFIYGILVYIYRQTCRSIKTIRKFVKQVLCSLFNYHCATHTHTGFFPTTDNWRKHQAEMFLKYFFSLIIMYIYIYVCIYVSISISISIYLSIYLSLYIYIIPIKKDVCYTKWEINIQLLGSALNYLIDHHVFTILLMRHIHKKKKIYIIQPFFFYCHCNEIDTPFCH